MRKGEGKQKMEEHNIEMKEEHGEPSGTRGESISGEETEEGAGLCGK